MRVQLSARSLVMPQVCACCAGTADRELPVAARRTTGKRKVKVETRTWMFPYCSACIGHVHVSASPLHWIVVVASLGLGVMLFIPSPELAVLLGTAGSALGVWMAIRKRARVAALRTANCAATGPAVAYLGWYRNVHEFEIASTDFAMQFAAANERKLVDPVPDLLGPAPTPPPPPQRSRKRNSTPVPLTLAPHPTGLGGAAHDSGFAAPVRPVTMPTTLPAPPPLPTPPRTPPIPPVDARPAAASPRPFVPAPRPEPPREPARSAELAGINTYRWLPRGGAVRVAGQEITGGMIYFGRGMPCAGGYRQVDPALVDPSLPVAGGPGDRAGASLPYWPSYSEIPPAARAAYLSWLATGRSERDFGIGYVFLFFYGLERRVLTEAHASQEGRAEIATIIAEVQRLRGLYGSHASFERYARAFLDVATLLQNPSPEVPPGAPPPEARPHELSALVRFDLARFAMAGKPIPADWALAWVVGHPETQLRTPAKRCPVELRDLFRARYADRNGEGIVIRPNRTKLVIRYQAASATFGGEVVLRLGDLPDIAALTKPLHALRDLLEECTSDLEAFSRWRGKNPSDRLGPAATALLPAELIRAHGGAGVDDLRRTVARLVAADGFGTIPADDLLAIWPGGEDGKLSKPESVQVAQLLEKLGFGMEPDVRFGGKPLKRGDTVVLFRLGQSGTGAPSPTYAGAALLLQLSAAVATADGSVESAEVQHLHAHIRSSLQLPEAERDRLAAYLRWLMATNPSMAGVAKRVSTLQPAQRRQIGEFLIGVAAADGRLSPDEVKSLTKVFGLLGLEPAELYSQMHAFGSKDAADDDEPLTVRPAGRQAAGHVIPPRPADAPAGGVVLDMATVRAKLEETAKVSALLSQVFTQEAEAPPAPAPEPVAGVAGLDALHSRFVRRLDGMASMSREELENLAGELGLMPDGALETINEAAFDAAGSPLLEGEDPITIDGGVWKELVG